MSRKQSITGKVFDNAIRAINVAKAIVLNNNQFNIVIELLASKFVWTIGVGKAGLAAKKLAVTLASNGRPASYLDAGNAFHGDFGAVRNDDCIVAFSNSGRTEEILRILMKTRDAGIKTVLITSNSDSVLGREATYCIEYGRVDEVCPLGLTPTTSCTVMNVVADCIAMAVQERCSLDYDLYASNHHSGYLGELARQKCKKRKCVD